MRELDQDTFVATPNATTYSSIKLQGSLDNPTKVRLVAIDLSSLRLGAARAVVIYFSTTKVTDAASFASSGAVQLQEWWHEGGDAGAVYWEPTFEITDGTRYLVLAVASLDGAANQRAQWFVLGDP